MLRLVARQPVVVVYEMAQAHALPEQVGIELGNLDLPTASLLSLRKYGENTAPIYVKGDEIADIKRTSMTNTINGSLHDLQGRRVTGTPQRGIYIRNGKKIVIK